MKKVLKLLLGILGICILALCIEAIVEEPGRRAALKAAMETAVELETPVLLKENEGKIVIVHGHVEMTEPAYDPELGITLNSPASRRMTETYEKVKVSDSDERDEYELQWKPDNMNIPKFYGRAGIGDFELAQGVLEALPVADPYDGFSEADEERYHIYYGTGSTYVSESLVPMSSTSYSSFYLNSDRDNVGAERYAYWVFDTSEEVTLVARQSGNQLVRAEELSLAPVHDGALDKATILENDGKYLIVGLILGAVAGLVCIFFGFRDRFFSKKQKKGRRE